MSTLPPLPKIDGDIDLMLDVYTHSSLSTTSGMNETYGDTLRLEQLGAKVLDFAVTVHLYNEHSPLNTAEEIRSKSIQYTSPATIDSWLDSYELKAKLRIDPSKKDEVLNDPLEMTKFFHIYVGAAYIRNGQDIVQNWISRLIDPNADVTTSAPPRADGHTQQAQPLPLVNSHAQPSVGTTSVTLALVNQTASQKRIQVAYPATQEGESHQPTWTVRCCMDGEEKGVGTGKSQKIAKEEAARQAWVAMGWGN